jgi:hypothetical protein
VSDRLERAAATVTREPIEVSGAGAYGGDEYHGIALVSLGEDGDYLTAYGHHGSHKFAAACDAFRLDHYGDVTEAVDPQLVDRVYAVMEHDELADEDDGYAVRWRDVQPSDLHAFPLTIWCADWQ